MSIVRALAHCEAGSAILEFRNDSNIRVVVESATASLANASVGASSQLLRAALELGPGDSNNVDVSAGLAKLFDDRVSGRQEKRVRVLLILDPEPSHQPGPGHYTAAFEGGGFVRFS